MNDDIKNIEHMTSDPSEPSIKRVMKSVTREDSAVKGNHYREKTGKDLFQLCKEGLMTREDYRSALVFNILRYILRYESKGNPVIDLKKAKAYLDELIGVVEDG